MDTAKVTEAQTQVDNLWTAYTIEKDILDAMTASGLDNTDAGWRAQCGKVNSAQSEWDWAKTRLRRIKVGLPG